MKQSLSSPYNSNDFLELAGKLAGDRFDDFHNFETDEEYFGSELIKNYFVQIQTASKINDLNSVSIFSVQLEHLNFRTSSARREIAHRILNQSGANIALFAFWVEKSSQWRLALVENFGGNTVLKEFIVGEGLTAKTAKTQLKDLLQVRQFAGIQERIQSLQKAFSVDAVTDKFYDVFDVEFKKLVADIGEKNHVEDFALLFVIRVLFLGFVQKKGWLGKENFLQKFLLEYKNNAENNTFYERWLKPLFFEALNSPIGTQVAYRNNEFSEETQKKLQMFPFLNGGLFKSKKGLDDLGYNLSDKAITSFFEFLFSYNFTIEENTISEQSLELNPELLGIIFEKLVNKADGAVYTQRTEVDLMCRLSLVKWLEKNQTTEIQSRDLYELFFREKGREKHFDDDQKDGSFSQKQVLDLLNLLENITICDPAVGSGAFPVGMMQTLDEIEQTLRSKINDPHLRDSAFERKKAIIQKSLYGVEVKEWAVWITHLRLWLSLLIEAPDEMKNQLTPILPSLDFKIRQGDSLVQRIGNKNFPVGKHANISKGLKDKLTKLKKLKQEYFQNEITDEWKVKTTEKSIFREICLEQIREKKEKLRFAEGRSGVQQAALFSSNQKEQTALPLNQKEIDILKKEIESLEEQERNISDNTPLIWNIEFAEIFGEKGGFDLVIGNPPYIRQEDIGDPYEKLSNEEYKDALAQMIYQDWWPTKPEKEAKKISGLTSKSDLFVYFYLRSLKLLNSSGIHIFICSNSWLDVGYGAWMQKFLIERCNIHFIIDNHAKRSFAHADVNTIISILGAPQKSKDVQDTDLAKFVAFKKTFEESIFTENLLAIENNDNIERNNTFRSYPISRKDLLESGMDGNKYVGEKWGGKFLRAPDIFFTILKKGNNRLVKLGKAAHVRRGFTTGANDFFYLEPTGNFAEAGFVNVKNKLGWEGDIEEKYLKPFVLKTNELEFLEVSNVKGFVFFTNKTKEELKNSKALEYLTWAESQKIEIKQGKDKGKEITGFHNVQTVKSRKDWYSLGERDVSPIWWIIAHNERSVAFSNFEALCSDNFFEITPNDPNQNLSMSGCLNSTVTTLFRELFGRSNFGGGVLKTQKPDVVKFPVLLDLNFEGKIDTKPIKSIFEECGINPKSSIPISEQEPKPLADRAELDKVVFDALDLTENERKEVYRAVCQLVWNRVNKAKNK